MTQESPDPEHHYEENGEDYRANRHAAMSETHHRHTIPSRRRTYSENAAVEQTEPAHHEHHHLRRRVKSGDDHKARDRNSILHHAKPRSSRSVTCAFTLGNHHDPWDREPLLPNKKIEVVLDTLAQVAICSNCNRMHSDDSSCDNNSSTPSCSSHSQSYEKISSEPNERDSFASTQEGLSTSCHDLNLAECNGHGPTRYSDIRLKNLNQNGVVNTGLDIYKEKPPNHVPDVMVRPANGHVPTGDPQWPEMNMLLEDDPSKASEIEKQAKSKVKLGVRAYVGLGVLLFANMLNYMDRYTIAGVLIDVQQYYNINMGQVGLLQTSFIISYMVFSPIFGFLGDRYSRKLIMSIGIFTWSVITLASSFIGQDYFYLFLFMRALVGIGEASYSTIAPTIIADLFVDTSRTKALSVFYFAIPVGSGLGYIAGSKVAYLAGEWQWALRVTPGLGIICVILIILVVKEPQRGAAEGSAHINSTSWLADLKYLFRHKSFLLSSAGFTCVAFVAGAMALWTPTYMYYSIRQRPENVKESNVSLIFGLITCGSGFTGVALGSWTASKLRHKLGAMADPLVCAFGLISCAPFLFLSLHLSRSNPILTWVLIFIGETLLSLNWALVTDILLYIVVPNRRSSAEAIQILMSHALGDAGSPYIIGQVADHIKVQDGFPLWRAGKYMSLQYSMYICCMVAVLGGGFFLATSLYIKGDKQKVEDFIKKSRCAGMAPGSQVHEPIVVDPTLVLSDDEPTPIAEILT